MSKISSKNIKKLSVPESPVVLAILDEFYFLMNHVQEDKKDRNTH